MNESFLFIQLSNTARNQMVHREQAIIVLSVGAGQLSRSDQIHFLIPSHYLMLFKFNKCWSAHWVHMIIGYEWADLHPDSLHELI